MRKNINVKMLNKDIILLIIFCSIFISSATIASAGQVVVDTNRDVILDDPSGWVSSAGDQWNGESTIIRWYVLALDSNGHAVPNIVVTTNLNYPNGTIYYSAMASTDSNGYANFSKDLNNINQITSPANVEGNWTINATATVESQSVIGSDRVIYDEYGCGKSGLGCHNSNWQSGGPGPQNVTTSFGTGTRDSPYTKGWDSIHSQNKTGYDYPHNKSGSVIILYGECLTCHKSYDGTYIGTSTRNNYQPQYGGGLHYGKANATCVDCHAGFSPSSTYYNMPIKKCYDCHPQKNNNVSIQDYIQSSTNSYSYLPLDTANGNIRAHNPKDTVACITCHESGHNVTKPNNTIAMSNTYTENEQCWACHTNRPTHYPSSGSNCVSCHTQDAHKVSLGGGPDCISCHNATGIAIHKVDVNAMTSGEHANINSGAIASGVSTDNKKCWGCHQTGGTQPTGMGDRYKNPYKCYDCHNATKPYNNVSSAPTVSEHFKNGTDIKSATSAIDDSASCLVCHNTSEMKVSYTEGDGLNNGSSLASHYGKNRSDLRVSGSTDCGYCHQNGSTIFSGAMVNVNNNNISNHSISISTPGCTNSTCHSTGKLHDSSLSKPASSNDSYCKTCHAPKSEHNSTLYCTECHANNTDGTKAGRDIHGIKFLQKDNTFSQSRTNAADCTTCHQLNAVDSSLGGIVVPKITNPLHHSDNNNNGSIWGTYWTNPVGACVYCHSDTKHQNSAFGRPIIWNPMYILNTPIGSGNNCADCHYKGDANYGAMKTAFESTGLQIPPEITNGSWQGKSGYYNHTLSGYSDSQCKSCHDKAGSTTVGQLTHNASVGIAGGPDCKSCHDIGSSAPAHINFSTAGDVGSIHSNLNYLASSTVNNESKKCWACHGNGSQPTGHPSNYKTPYVCEDCHTNKDQSSSNSEHSKGINCWVCHDVHGNMFITPYVKQHYWNGSNITVPASCSQCHNRSEMLNPANDPDIGSIGGGNNSSSHYGKKRSDLATLSGTNSYCNYCHNTSVNNMTFYVRDYNNSIVNHSVNSTTPLCGTCHNTGRLHDKKLVKPIGSDNLCKTCHANKNEHKTLYCTECHANATNGGISGRDIHGIKFLQKDNTFSQSRTNAADCTTCHQLNAVDSSLGGIVVPKISNSLYHSNNISNGSVWGTYWTNPIGACIYCHNDTKHNATPLGRPLSWNSSYVLNTAIDGGTNCDDCHYKGDVNYGAMNSAFTSAGLSIPPEITNGSWQGKPGYYNHTLNDYTDIKCKSCHDKGSSTVGQMMHTVQIGGGDDCISCHNSVTPASTMTVDIAVFNTSVHQNVNNTPINITNNYDCWSCHYLKDMNRQNIKKCRDCHAKPQQWHGYANVTTNLTILSNK